ncbi:MAG TPA: hypothetical protein VFM98_22085 [Ramlibacter sp.]|nr:hypothetical protein [Ramlibacter sp.]HET8748301.1 hypothetical protein [Ramlibacter sp.]
MKILFTGAAGLSGPHTAQRLLAPGEEIVGGGNLSGRKGGRP